ncbi:MAG: hypothetical protein ACE5KM_10865 [Planctomycetaceae bacterium]
MKQAAIQGLVLALTMTLAGCGGGDKKTGNGNGDNGDGGVTVDQSTPQKTAESWKKALSAKDWKSVFACVTEESRLYMPMGLMMTASFSAGSDKDKDKSLKALLTKHGAEMSFEEKKAVGGVKDKAAFVGALVDWMEKNAPPKDGKPGMIEQMANAELSNFKIDGDKATADISFHGKKQTRPAEFTKIGGKWYLAMSGKAKKKEKQKAKPFPKM